MLISRKEELQYISDTAFMNALSDNIYRNEIIQKQAGVVSDLASTLFGSVAESIKEFAKEMFLGSTEDTATTIINMIVDGALFSMGPLGIIASVVSSVLGIDIGRIAVRVVQSLYSKINSGTVSSSDISNTVKSTMGLGDLSSMAYSSDLEVIKIASIGGGIFKSIFKKLGVAKGKLFAGGIISWVLRTIFIGGSAVIAGKSVGKMVGVDTQDHSVTDQIMSRVEPMPFKASGRGQKTFKNDDNNYWIVPLKDKNVYTTVLLWAKDVYPELKDKDYAIKESNKFLDTVRTLYQNAEPGSPDNLTMPHQFHSRKEVVDTFARDVARIIKEKNETT